MNADGIVVDDAVHDGDLEAFARLDAESFGSSVDQSLTWMRKLATHAMMRVARVGGAIVGGYGLLPVGQFYGGRSVPAHAVVGVCVDPASRRHGIAGRLMSDLVDRSRAAGGALAPLHASTTRLYRRWGWEVGDRGLNQIVRTTALAHLHGSGAPVRAPSHASLEALRRTHLPAWDGPLDRPDWWLSVEWDVEDDPHEPRRIFGWQENGALTGFVRYRMRRGDTPGIVIGVDELMATTPDALRGLLGLLGGLEAQAPQITFYVAAIRPKNELLYLIPDGDRATTVVGRICWMQRMVDPVLAVRKRGWPSSGRAELHLEVTDPVRSDATRYVLEVADGEGELTPGGEGRVRCGIGALSAWYAGALRARDAVRLGLLEAEADDVRRMDSLLGDRDAWMPDFF